MKKLESSYTSGGNGKWCVLAVTAILEQGSSILLMDVTAAPTIFIRFTFVH